VWRDLHRRLGFVSGYGAIIIGVVDATIVWFGELTGH
jgi:hypothetical protein